MPREKRPSAPPSGSIPPRSIAPKPALSDTQLDRRHSTRKAVSRTPSLSRHSAASSEEGSRTCGVPGCNTRNCALATHLNYGRQRRHALLHSEADLDSNRSRSGYPREATLSLTLQPDIEEELELPVEDTATQDFRKLLVQFFTEHFDRLMLIYRPQRKDPAVRQVAYRLMLHNPVYCLTLVAQAHISNIKDDHPHLKPVADGLTDLIYTRLLKVTREEIESFDIENIDVLLLAIVALCEYDLMLDRYESLRSHQIGMGALVARCGGIHNLGMSLPFVQRMDRFLALRLNQIPQFSPPELPHPSVVMRQSTDNLVYGSALHQRSNNLSKGVLSLCSDAAQLLSLMDELNVTFEPSQLPDVLNPKLEYFYFLREDIDVRHAVLNQQCNLTSTMGNKDLLVLTTTKLVIYYIGSANYLPMVTDQLSSRLWNLLISPPLVSSQSPSRVRPLERSDSDQANVPMIDLSDWVDDMPMLLWLLFASALTSCGAYSLSFVGHITSGPRSLEASRSSSVPPRPSQLPTDSRASSYNKETIASPSSPRRHRYLPSFLLHVAEHLVGERPLSATTDWDEAVTDILESFVWAGDRLSTEYESIIGQIHEIALKRDADDP